MAQDSKPFVLLPPELLQGLYVRVLAAARRRQTAWSPAVITACEAHLRPGDMAVVRKQDSAASASLAPLRHEAPPGRPRQSSAAAPPLNEAAGLEACYGLALAQRTLDNKGVVLVFAGQPEDIWSQGTDTLQRCAAQRLPILFVTQARLEDSSPLAVDGSRPRLPRVAVDANDTVAIYRVTQECIRMARAGGGPTWLDCQVVEALKGERRIPGPSAVTKMKQYLDDRKLFSDTDIRQATTRFDREAPATSRYAVLDL